MSMHIFNLPIIHYFERDRQPLIRMIYEWSDTLYRYRCGLSNGNNDDNGIDFCALIDDALGKARKVRKRLTKVILYGYGEAGDELGKAVKEIESIYETLLTYIAYKKCENDNLLCRDDIGLNNAKVGSAKVLENLGWIIINYHDCDDLESLINDANELFSTYVLSTLSKMKSECYKTEESMLRVKCNDYKAVHCTGENSDPLEMCSMLDDAYGRAKTVLDILENMFADYELEDSVAVICDDVLYILDNNLREYVNLTHLIYSQMPVTKKVCSAPIVEARLMESNRLAAALRRLLNREDFEDGCNQLYFLSIYYELAESITAMIDQVRYGIGCSCKYKGGKY